MAYKRLIADVITDIETGEYNEIQSLYDLLVNQSGVSYTLTEECTNYTFGQQQYGSCTVATMDLVYDVLNNYSADNKRLAFTLFGYDIPYYLTVCDDNGVCECNDNLINERNISSQRLYGILTDDNYLSNLYPKSYLIQVDYNETDNKIYFSAEHSVVDPPYDPANYYQINSTYYRNKLTVTYLGFDNSTAKFAEQIILDGAHKDNKVWEYEVGTFNCYHHNTEPCVTELEDYTNLTEYVAYVDGKGFLSFQTLTTPVIYTNRLTYEDGKPRLDGLYKTYYFLFPYLTEILTGLSGTMVVTKNEMFYFAYIDDDNNTIEEYCYSNNSLSIDYTTSTAVSVVNTDDGTTIIYDLTTNQGKIDFKNAYFITMEGFELLKRIQYIPNVLRANTYPSYDVYFGEDAHLITYELRYNIVESIKDCNIPCEKFSFDTWVALKQKKSAASIFFCNESFTETARIMTTLEERCKNCD